MDRRTIIKTLPTLTVLVDALPASAEKPTTATLQPIVLPKPEKEGGKSVLAALWERKTNRNISDQKLPLQTVALATPSVAALLIERLLVGAALSGQCGGAGQQGRLR